MKRKAKSKGSGQSSWTVDTSLIDGVNDVQCDL